MVIDIYKEYLDKNTNLAMDKEDESKSRYYSFKKCIEMLPVQAEVLELGTCRSFVDGAFEGCNSDDTRYWNHRDISRWDWGAGCFGLVFGMHGYKMTSVDIIHSHITRCKHMMDSLDVKCEHVVSDSVNFLRNTNKKFDLIFVDTGDMWPIEPTSQLQLDEVSVICERNLLKEGGILLIDDVLNKTPREQGDVNNKYGKSDLALPYLLNNGFKVIFEGYQYILSR